MGNKRSTFSPSVTGVITLSRRIHTQEHKMKAIWNGVVVAESDDIVVVEGNHYFPESSLKREYTLASNRRTMCSWKGEANYYTLFVDGDANQDAVWYYADPKEAAQEIKGRVAFQRGVLIEE
jgi:uncharacterized protein (DUF427 family)